MGGGIILLKSKVEKNLKKKFEKKIDQSKCATLLRVNFISKWGGTPALSE